MALFSANGEARSRASRSVSVTMPRSSPAESTTGAWWKPCSSIRSRTSSAVISCGTVVTGKVITSAIGVSAVLPTASTRVRRSRSVRMPHPPSSGHEDRGGSFARHEPRRLGHGRLPVARDRRTPDQRPDRGHTDPSAGFDRPFPWAVVTPRCRADEGRTSGREAQRVLEGAAVDQVAERVFVCPHHGGRSRRGPHRPEHVALTQQIDDPIAFDEFDGARSYDVHHASGLVAVPQDHRALRVELDLRRRRDALQSFGLELVERGVLGQEPDDVHRRQYDAGWIAHHGWGCVQAGVGADACLVRRLGAARFRSEGLAGLAPRTGPATARDLVLSWAAFRP